MNTIVPVAALAGLDIVLVVLVIVLKQIIRRQAKIITNLLQINADMKKANDSMYESFNSLLEHKETVALLGQMPPVAILGQMPR